MVALSSTARGQEVAGAAQSDAARADLIPTRSLFELLLSGGPMIVPILISSFLMLLIVFERTITLRRSRVVPKLFVSRFLMQMREDALTRADALERCEQNSSHIAQVFAAAVRKWGKPAVEVEQAVLDEGERVANVMRRYLRVVNGISTVCPLFGLLGTVWGMVQSFNAIAVSAAIGRPEMLAGGIGGALISTAAGLCVAIPALIFYIYLVGKIDNLVMEVDRWGQQIVHLISAEALDERRSDRGAPAPRPRRVA
jgi:biopolymer transport protein ExbB